MDNKAIIAIVAVAILFIGGLIVFGSQGSNKNQNTNVVTQPTPLPSVMEDDMVEETEEEDGGQTIVDIAAANDDFSILVTAVTEAGLVDTLSGEGPYTVFAPTNAAFEALGQETIDAVLADQEQLTNILTYHVVPGKVMAEQVVTLDSATAVNGQELTIQVSESGTVQVNNANVVSTDIEASNGVIHVIDTVLLPE